MTLEERVSRLEVQLRYWRSFCMVAIIVALGLVVAGAAAPGPKVVEAQKFVVRDDAGNVVAVLGRNPSSQAGARLLLEAPGGARTEVAAISEEAFLFISDSRRKTRVGLVLSNDTGASVQLSGKKGKEHVALALDSKGRPMLSALGEESGPGLILPGVDRGKSSFAFSDLEGAALLTLK